MPAGQETQLAAFLSIFHVGKLPRQPPCEDASTHLNTHPLPHPHNIFRVRKKGCSICIIFTMCGDPPRRATLAAPQRTLEATRASPKEKGREERRRCSAADNAADQISIFSILMQIKFCPEINNKMWHQRRLKIEIETRSGQGVARVQR